MKAKGNQFRLGLPKAAASARLFFLCGPDEAGATEAGRKIAAALPDGGGERIDLPGGVLKADPAKLGDEARSGSLFGGSRHLWIRATGDDCLAALTALTETIDADGADGAQGVAPVIVVATAATEKARSAKLLGPRPDSLVATFYPPDEAALASDVRALGDAAGLRIDPALARRIAVAARGDVRLARAEIEKLALYCDADPTRPQTAREEDWLAIGALREEDGFAPLVEAVLAGDLKALPGELARIRSLGLSPVGIALALERRAAQLAGLRAKLGRGDPAALIDAEKAARRVFWNDAPALKRQLPRWAAGDRMERLTARLVALHRALMTRGDAADAMLAQELTAIARFAASGR